VPGRIHVVGDTALDYYLWLPRRQLPGGSADEKITAERATRSLGGTGANAAVAARTLGSDVCLHSAVGDDLAGCWLTSSAAAQGVDTAGVQVFGGASTHATILLDGSTRQVIVERGVADRLELLAPPPSREADVVYLTGSGAVVCRLAQAGLAGFLVAGVESGMAGTPGLPEALRQTQLVITNTAGWQAFAGQLPSRLPVIQTQGAGGITIHHPGRQAEHLPAVPARVVDATGAGDCFAGALCHYLRAGLNLDAAARLALAAAALSTQALGAQGALPSDHQVRETAAQAGTASMRSEMSHDSAGPLR
jgi:ribokinase